jgi:hypothetical protein
MSVRKLLKQKKSLSRVSTKSGQDQLFFNRTGKNWRLINSPASRYQKLQQQYPGQTVQIDRVANIAVFNFLTRWRISLQCAMAPLAEFIQSYLSRSQHQNSHHIQRITKTIGSLHCALGRTLNQHY